MPFIVVVFIFIGIIVFKNMMNNAAQQAKAQRNSQNVPVQRPLEQQSSPSAQQRAQTAGKPAVYPGQASTLAEQRKQEIQRQAMQMKEQAKALRDAIEGRTPAATAKPAQQPRPAAQTARPVMNRADDDCGGGSIHDGYHEGVSGDPFGEHKGTAVAGNLGKRLGAEAEKQKAAQSAADNAKRAMEKISKLPPIAQGIVYSEILGKPKSETA